MKKILAVGAVMVDMVAPLDALPTSGEGVVIEGLRSTMGGCAFNSANIVRQLGQPVFLFAPVGVGTYASFVREELAKRGMEALEIPDAPCDCGAAICFVEPDGQRTMVTFPGIERRYESSWWDRIDPEEFSSAFVGGYEVDGVGGDAIISFFEAHPQVQLTYAPGPRVMNIGPEKTARINALHPVWHLNDQEAVAYAKQISLAEAGALLDAASDDEAQALIREAGAAIQVECQNVVVVTAGGDGSYAFLPEDDFLFVPTEAIKPVDTIGAGDSHLGAVMAARHAGKDWREALQIANRVAAAVCGAFGSTLSDEEFALLGIEL